MSDTLTRRPHREAMADGEKLFELIGRGVCRKWILAGSIRRQRADVGDVEHLIIPQFGPDPDNLFAADGNLLWRKLDALYSAGAIDKHRKNGVSCWGEKSRRVEYPRGSGHAHDVCLAAPDNWGVLLAVKTGPWDYSKLLVSIMKRRGYECRDGFFVYRIGEPERVPVPDEKQFVTQICGLPWAEPWERKA